MTRAEVLIYKLVDERDALVDKMFRLGNFIASPEFYKVSGDMQSLQKERYAIMENYASVIEDIIELLEKDV